MLDNASVDGVKIHELIAGAPSSIAFGLSKNPKGLFGQPSPKPLRISKPRAHGSIDRTSYLEGRLIDLVGRVRGTTFTDLQAQIDTLLGLFDEGADHLLVFRRTGFAEDERVTFRVASALDIDVKGGTSLYLPWAVTVFCSDPRRYSDALKSGSYDPTTGFTGRGVQMTGGMDVVPGLVFTGPASAYLNVSNAGNRPTPPVFTITGPIVAPIIDDDSTGAHIFTTNLSLASTDVVVIDVAAKTLKVNGTIRQDFFDGKNSSWFELGIGVNLLRLRGTGMVAAQTSLAVSFRDARV